MHHRLHSLIAAAALISSVTLSCSDQSGSSGTAQGGESSHGVVTWHEHIAPLVTEKCGSCHTTGGIAPFSIETYEEAKEWAAQMSQEIKKGTMPPWGAEETDECTPPGSFKDDLRLSDDQKELFYAWVAGGRLEGSPKDAADLPEPASLELDSPSRSLSIPSGVTVEGTADRFVCFTLDPEITEEVWLTGSQVRPGNPSIVHHALVFLDREGQGEDLADENGQYECFGSPLLDDVVFLGAWAPGAVPSKLPESMGKPLHPGDKLVVQLHYHPTGKGAEVDDSTAIDLKWTTTEPDYVGGMYLIGNIDEVGPDWAGGEGYGLLTGPDFVIPAGATEHQEINKFWIDDGGDFLARAVPIYVWMVGTHMHYVGTDMKITVEDDQGNEQCLVQTPHWDFNWQRAYFYDGAVKALPVIHAGDSFTMRCTYNNSLENPFVRQALDDQGKSEPHDVALGEQTLDEMCLGVFGLAVEKQYAKAFGF